MKQRLAVGSVVKDTYTILDRIGEGAFSEVFLVRHRFLGLQAMKVFKSNSLTPGVDQFKEAFILSKIANSNIIHIFEANKIVDSSGERAYVTMEYAVGGTLDTFLASQPILFPESATRIQKQICLGLSAAHSQMPPIVHRDVKPQNILVTSIKGEVIVKVADFGLARNIDPKLRMASAAGTLLYMPPEGFHHYETPASDVYSAGIVYYEMLTGTFPFPRVTYTNEQEFRLGLANTRAQLPPAPSTIRNGVGRNLDEVCLKALQPDLKKRFQSGMEFLAALETLNSRSPVGNSQSQNGTADAIAKAQRALELGRQYSELPQAIRMLEEAFREEPSLQEQYGIVLSRWKSGVVM